ncbi:MAG: glutathione S-transferase family protein [Hyphomicrobiales bacterium]|nr:glutathione S-transferase family protein [Hyphomicrobiales bacterium]
MHLTIANKAYSSWSLRPWILMRHFAIPFDETVVRLRQSDTAARLLAVSPAGKAPVLQDGDIYVWESLAIMEYLAESLPHLAIWPRDKAARAHARALACEMHAGFMALRQACPTNFRRAPGAPRQAIGAEALANVARIEALIAGSRQRYGAAGAFLFGEFCAADAMYAPVVNRLYAYDLKVNATTRAYMAAMQALPAWQAWHKDAAAEPWVIEDYEIA